MVNRYSRRDFLAGVLATGTLSAATMYFAPGGRPAPAVPLRFIIAVDPTGATNLLVRMWNRANPRTMVVPDYLDGSTSDQLRILKDRAQSGAADIVGLDVIHIPHFQSCGLIAPIALENEEQFLSKTLEPSRFDDPGPGQFWAAPFSADVGMLFERVDVTSADARQALTTLPGVIGSIPDGSRQFAGQLRPISSSSYEAFTVNVLEHALAQNGSVLDANNMPARQLEVWQNALTPLQTALSRQQIRECYDEADTSEAFRTERLRYMRNWPGEYRTLQRLNDPDAEASRIRVRSLPAGVIGGSSLALVRRSSQTDRASDFIRFMTGDEAQKVLAYYGVPVTQNGPYADGNLEAAIPHLKEIKGSIESGRLRPIHPNYSAFSLRFSYYVKSLLWNGSQLPTRFVEELQEILNTLPSCSS